MCEDFAPNFGDKRTGCCITTMHRLTVPFSAQTFDQTEHDCRPLPTKARLRGSHFDTTGVIVAELQAVLNTLLCDGQQTPHKRSDFTTQVNLRKQTYLRSNNIEIAVSLQTIAKYQIRTQH
jgi:hypothetical protein